MLFLIKRSNGDTAISTLPVFDYRVGFFCYNKKMQFEIKTITCTCKKNRLIRSIFFFN